MKIRFPKKIFTFIRNKKHNDCSKIKVFILAFLDS